MKAMKTTLKATLVATAIATLPFASQAAGLGSINVLSGLGQPLRAEIELQATAQELQSLTARVAPVEAFRQASVGYSPVMTGLQFSVETRGNRSLVRVTSDRPVTEPFLEMLVELNWSGGRLLREYTFLLDPVELARPPMAAAQVAAPPVAAQRPVAAAPRTTAPAGDYRVRRGDTLRGIANANRPADVTLEQMLIALLRQNPQAFDEGNINRLRAGAILSMPDQATARTLEPAQARREVVAQAADFEAYRSRLAGTVAARPAAAPPVEARESVGQISARVDEVQASDAPQDRVEVSAATTEGADPTRLARLQALEEELVARERSLDEANNRLNELEQSIRDLQRLIELRNQSLAQLQRQLEEGDSPSAEVALPSPMDLLSDDFIADTSPVAPVADAPPMLEEADTPSATEAADIPEERTLAAAEAPGAVAVAPTAPAAEPAPAAAAAPPQPVAPQPTLLQSLLQDPMLMAGGGAVLVLLLLYAGYRVRQKRKDEDEAEAVGGLSGYPSEAHSVFGGKGGQSVDTGSSSVLHTDFSQSGLSSIDADEGVDPVAEADVYMAYGRDAQAEEILLDALKADASRAAIYIKLLEIYAQRQSPRQFESVATDLYSRVDVNGPDWAKAAEMGRKLDPENPLYKASPEAANGADAASTETGRGAPGSDGRDKGVAAVAGIAALGAAASMRSDAEASEQVELPESFSDADVIAQDSQLSDIDFTTSMPVEPSASQLKDTWTMPGDLSRLSQAVEDGSAEDVSRLVDEGSADDSSADGSADEEGLDVDFSVLDFDLGGDESPVVSAPVKDAGEAAASADVDVDVDGDSELSASADDGLQFDLDVGDVPTGTSLGAPTSDEDALKKTVLGDELDFALDGDDAALDFGIPDVQSPAPFDPQSLNATVVGNAMDLASAESAIDDDADRMSSGVSDRRDNLGANPTVLEQDYLRSASDDDAESLMDLEKTGFDNSLLDFDFDLETTSNQAGVKAPEMDFSTIDLDLELPDDSSSQVMSDVGDAKVTEASAQNHSVSPEVQQEVETKLDLARAYEEMGDKDGARELIDEVLREGSASQRELANKLLERLG